MCVLRSTLSNFQWSQLNFVCVWIGSCKNKLEKDWILTIMPESFLSCLEYSYWITTPLSISSMKLKSMQIEGFLTLLYIDISYFLFVSRLVLFKVHYAILHNNCVYSRYKCEALYSTVISSSTYTDLHNYDYISMFFKV